MATMSASLNIAPTCAAPSAPSEAPSRPTPATTPNTAAHSRQDSFTPISHEAERVEAHADDEPPLTQQPDDQPRVDAPGSVLGRLVAGCAYRDRLHHRGDAVQQRRHDGRDQAD